MNYEKRLSTEYVQLKERLAKLSGFVNNSAEFEIISKAKQDLMVRQLKCMREYLSILADRLELESINIHSLPTQQAEI